jgi:hypothetical protein
MPVSIRYTALISMVPAAYLQYGNMKYRCVLETVSQLLEGIFN